MKEKENIMKNRRRKLVCIGMAILMTLSSMPVTAWAEPVTPQEAVAEQPVMEDEVSGTGEVSAEGFYYDELEDGTLEITRYSGSDTGVVIPAEINGKAVTRIGDDAFAGCSDMTSIELPEGITSIGTGAFYNCSRLISIKLPVGVMNIEGYAFYKCIRLTSIKLPSGVTNIGEFAFYGCNRLTSMELPSGLTSIEDCTFFDCSSLTSIKLPKGVTSIGYNTFSGCSSLTSIELPVGITSIGVGAFYGCNSLAGIKLPEGLTSIEGCAFSGCSSLTSIKIPGTVTDIGADAFSRCSSLTSIEIGSGVTGLQWEMFCTCDNLSDISVDEGNTQYSSQDGVVFDKDKTTLIYCPKGKAGDYQIPAGVTTINANALNGCYYLKHMEIPSGVINIGTDAFSGCGNLVILCDENSYAHTYAVENNIAFQLIVKYTITFDTNGGDALDQTSLVLREGDTLGELPAPTCTGYTFKGWFTEKTGGTAVTKDTIPTADMTIYAQWEQVQNGNDSGKPGDTPDQTQQKQSLEKAVVTVAKADYAYDGKAKTPAVSVALDGKKLAASTDYTVTYRNNKNIGTATVTVTGAGNYTGTVTKTFAIRAKKGTSVTGGAYKYKITNSKEVAFAGLKSAKTKKVVIPKTVKIGGKTFKVTSVAKKALYKKSKVTSVTIGANVKTIGASAFAGCKKLSTITIKSNVLKSAGKNAFKGIKATAKIKVPSKKLKAYKKILKGRGQGRKVKIVKK